MTRVTVKLPPAPPQASAPQEDTTTEHVFEVTVERVKGLTPLQSTVWGEADCYVQYSFPTQEEDSSGARDSHAVESGRPPAFLCCFLSPVYCAACECCGTVTQFQRVAIPTRRSVWM